MNLFEDQVKDLENTRGANIARMGELTTKAAEAGRSFDEAEAQEYDDLESEVTQLDKDITRVKNLIRLQNNSMATAQPVVKEAGQNTDNAARVRGGMLIVKKEDPDEKFEGQSFTRICIAKALGRENQQPPGVIAERLWGKSHKNLVQVIKGDVAGHGSASGDAGEELVHYNRYLGDFVEYLYGKTVYFNLPLREVPANINIGKQTGAAGGYWVGAGKGIPVTQMDTASVNLTPLKVAAIAVAEKEWLRDSSPSAEMLVRDTLVQAGAQKIDGTFFSTAAAVSGVSPAGILNNIPAKVSAGTDGDAVANDLKELFYVFTAAKNAGGQVLCMNPALATSLSLLRNALGQYEFPTVNDMGGTLIGKTVYTGDNINANHLIMLKPSDIWRIGSGMLEVTMSDQASIEMESAPAQDAGGPTAATGKVISTFQTESVAFKMVQPMNFKRRRESAVAYTGDADYGGAIST